MVVDGNPEVRRVIRQILADFADEIHECATPYDAFAAYRQYWPDVVVMDLGTPPRDGIWGTRQILSLDPRAVVVLVASYPDATFRATASLAGARGFVLKENLLHLRLWLSGSSASE